MNYIEYFASLKGKKITVVGFGVSNRPKSCVYNSTELKLDEDNVTDALRRFTDATMIPIAVKIDYIDNVFEKPNLLKTDIGLTIILVAVCAVIVEIMIIRELLKYPKKNRDYDRSRYKKQI